MGTENPSRDLTIEDRELLVHILDALYYVNDWYCFCSEDKVNQAINELELRLYGY